uniref:Uncharacterized protein n=1 Tax=Macrostomum lignano TaxID=282301 RepID=A0A1I8HVJ1_9PLAT
MSLAACPFNLTPCAAVE